MTGGVPIPGKRSLVLLLACALLLVSALMPVSVGKTETQWDGGEKDISWVCRDPNGGELAKNISLPRNSDINGASIRVHGDPYIMDEGQRSQSLQSPQNPSMDLFGDGVADWAFQGSMGIQTVFSGNATESSLMWNAPGQTRSLDFTIPRSTIRSASVTVNNTDARKFSYAMNMGGTGVWSRESLSFSYSATSFTRETIDFITTGDINYDGKPEMVAGGANGKVYVTKMVNGKWVNATIIDLQVQNSQRDITQVALGMLDETPGLDIVAACADGNVYYLLNQGGAGLYSGANQLLSGSPGRMASVCVEDVNNDGNNDIVAGNLNGRFYVFLNLGEAQFDALSPESFKVVPGGNGQMNGVAVADIDLDGLPDLIGANTNKNFYIARGTGGNSNFDNAKPVITTATRDMNSIYVEDVNGDTHKDLVGASNDGRLYICINLGGPNFGSAPGTFDTQPGHIIKLTMESGTNSLRTATAKDVNGDGTPDIVALGTSNMGQVFIAINENGIISDKNILRPFSAGQTSRSLSVDDMDGDGDPDIATANGNRMDVWLNNQGRFAEAITGPGLVSALQEYVNNAPAEADRFGNPMVNCSILISNRYPGALNFSGLQMIYDYTATADITTILSDHMNATAGIYSEGEMVTIPVIFRMQSPGTLNITGLMIDSEIGLVPIIDFPKENGTLYVKETVYLTGRANKDIDGNILNYTWTDNINGRFLGFGNRVRYTPVTKWNMSVQLLVRDELHAKEATMNVHFNIVDRPMAILSVAKVAVSDREPNIGDKVSIKVYIKNTGKVNATNVAFQIYLDKVKGVPIAAAYVPKLDIARTNYTEVSWYVSITGTHKLLIVVVQSDQPYTTSTEPYEVDINVQTSTYPILVPAGYVVIGGGIAIGLGATAFFLGATEVGTYLLFLLFLPLYSKIKPEEVLDRFIRGKILGYIRANPGCHYNLIKQDLKLHNGTLIHHLDTLERNGFVKSARDGILRRFFPGDQKIPLGRFYMSPIQESMSRYIREHPGVSQAELTRGLYLEPHLVRYHIRILKEASVLRVEEEGRRTKLFLR